MVKSVGLCAKKVVKLLGVRGRVGPWIFFWSSPWRSLNLYGKKKVIKSYMKLIEVCLPDPTLQCDAPFQMGPEHSHGADLP